MGTKDCASIGHTWANARVRPFLGSPRYVTDPLIVCGATDLLSETLRCDWVHQTQLDVLSNQVFEFLQSVKKLPRYGHKYPTLPSMPRARSKFGVLPMNAVFFIPKLIKKFLYFYISSSRHELLSSLVNTRLYHHHLSQFHFQCYSIHKKEEYNYISPNDHPVLDSKTNLSRRHNSISRHILLNFHSSLLFLYSLLSILSKYLNFPLQLKAKSHAIWLPDPWCPEGTQPLIFPLPPVLPPFKSSWESVTSTSLLLSPLPSSFLVTPSPSWPQQPGNIHCVFSPPH